LEHFYAVKTLDECLNEGGTYGRYSDDSSGGSGTPGNMPHNILPTNLKGSDLQLCAAARALGLPVSILPVVSLERWDKDELSGAVESEPLSPTRLEVTARFHTGPDGSPRRWWDRYEGDEGWPEFLKETGCLGAADIAGDLLWVKPPGKQHLKYCGAATQYEGNNGNTTYFYAAAVLLVVVPPADAPARQG
jgi:hypothetical protein